MNATELRKKNLTELNDELAGLLREQFNLRMQKGTGQLSKPSQFKTVSRSIARVKTIINEKFKSVPPSDNSGQSMDKSSDKNSDQNSEKR